MVGDVGFNFLVLGVIGCFFGVFGRYDGILGVIGGFLGVFGR